MSVILPTRWKPSRPKAPRPPSRSPWISALRGWYLNQSPGHWVWGYTPPSRRRLRPRPPWNPLSRHPLRHRPLRHRPWLRHPLGQCPWLRRPRPRLRRHSLRRRSPRRPREQPCPILTRSLASPSRPRLSHPWHRRPRQPVPGLRSHRRPRQPVPGLRSHRRRRQAVPGRRSPRRRLREQRCPIRMRSLALPSRSRLSRLWHHPLRQPVPGRLWHRRLRQPVLGRRWHRGSFRRRWRRHRLRE